MNARSAYQRSLLAALILFLGCALAGGLAAVAYQAVVPQRYGAYGQVLVGPPPGIDADRYVANQIAIASSPAMIRSAAQKAGVAISVADASIGVSQESLSSVLRFTAQSTSELVAMRLVASAEEAYVANPIIHARANGTNGSAVILLGATATGPSGLDGTKVLLIGLSSGLVVAFFIFVMKRDVGRRRLAHESLSEGSEISTSASSPDPPRPRVQI